MGAKIVNVSLLVVVVTVLAGVAIEPATGQVQPTIRWVDALYGNDSWTGTSPTFTPPNIGPWKRISHALLQMSGQQNVIIRVIGRVDVSGAPVRHTNAHENGNFPLDVGRKQRIEKDLVNSVGPVIIDGSGVSADLITFGSDGQSTDSFGGLKNIWVYDAPNAAVYVNPAANKDVSPAFSGLRFNRCFLGLEIVSKYAAGTASPSVQSCYFHNSTDAWDATGPGNLRAHISIIASDATRTASPSITNCTFESQYPGRVTDGIYTR
ncbi:MAG: hypothetical protein AB1486_07185 [Planctomycetota bacterium]